MTRMAPIAAAVILVTLVLASFAIADVPQMINYQGHLTDSSGDPLDTSVFMVFTIYDDSTGGTVKWTEVHQMVEVSDGLFSVLLGSNGSLPDSVFNQPDRWLGIIVGNDQELVPRTRLVSVGYSHRVSTVDGATGGIISGDVSIQSDLDIDGDLRLTGKATIGPGHNNAADYGFVAGQENMVSGLGSSIGGGRLHNAAGMYATIGGGFDCTASGDYGTVPGGSWNEANGDYSFAAGQGAKALHNNCFVWQDGTPSDFASTGVNQFLIRASGGVGIGTNDPDEALEVAGTVYSTSGGFKFPDGTVQTTAAAGGGNGWVYAGNYVRLETSDDSVGIGTTVPTAKLHVIGPVYAEGRINCIKSYDTPDDVRGVYSYQTNYGSGDVTALDGYARSDSDQRYGVWAYATTDDDTTVGSSIGVRGNGRYGSSCIGVMGDGAHGNTVSGVRGSALWSVNRGYGVYGQASSNNSHGYGVYATASNNDGTSYGVWATASGSTTNWAGYFSGDVNVTGNVSKGGGSFKIDHPLDPENKWLYHSFVESPDMMNIYNGNIVLDANGKAVVELAEYFTALNKDFRYQLTCIGGFAPVYVARKIENNRFEIAGGQPGMEVSWQVTGVRKDAYAEAKRIPVEVEKGPDERGKYAHPEAFGLSAERGIDYDDQQAANVELPPAEGSEAGR